MEVKTLQILGIFDMLKKRDYDIEYYKEKLQKCKETEAETLISMGYLYYDEEEYDDALECYKKSIELYGELGSEEGEAFVLDLIGDIYLSKRDTQNALKNYNESFKLYAASKNPLKDEMFEKIKEVEKIKDAIKYVEEDKEQETLPITKKGEKYSPDYENIGNKLENVIQMLESARGYEIYCKEENPMEQMQELLNTSREINDAKGQATLLLFMGDISLKNEKTDIALDYFKKGYEIFSILDDEKGKGISLVLIGTVHFILGNMDIVSSNFRKAIEIFRKLNDAYAESVTKDLLNSLYND